MASSKTKSSYRVRVGRRLRSKNEKTRALGRLIKFGFKHPVYTDELLTIHFPRTYNVVKTAAGLGFSHYVAPAAVGMTTAAIFGKVKRTDEIPVRMMSTMTEQAVKKLRNSGRVKWNPSGYYDVYGSFRKKKLVGNILPH